MFDLEERVAIVTGGNGGIGLGMARGLARAGAHVVVAARNAEKSANAVREIERVGGHASAVSVDVADDHVTSDLRRWTLRAIALLSVLNLLDVVLTKTFIRAGFAEGNPIMAGLVQDWRMGAIKAIILGALFLRATTSKPNVTRVCLLWGAVGVYALASYVNWQAIQQIAPI